jgi:hypothetical protein
VYVRAARLLWQGEDIYRGENGYLYPPFMTVLALPYTALPSLLVRGAWFLVNVLCIVLLLRWSWRLAGGSPLQGGPAPPREHIVALVGALCGIVYIQNCLAHQQTDLLIAVLLLGGCLLLTRSRTFAAATCFGTAAAFKCTPLLWAPYLVWRRRPGAAAWVFVLAVGLNFLPDLVHGGPNGRTWLATYAERFLAPLTSAHHYIGTWGSDPIYNQSISGGTHRWFLTQLVWSADNCTIEPHATTASPRALRGLAYGAALVLLLLAVGAAGRPATVESLPRADLAVECCIVLLLMLLLSPMSSIAHFATLLVPGHLLARRAATSSRWSLWFVPVGAAVLALTASKDLLREKMYTVLLWGGSVTAETLLLLAGCLIALYVQRRQIDSASEVAVRRAA